MMAHAHPWRTHDTPPLETRRSLVPGHAMTDTAHIAVRPARAEDAAAISALVTELTRRYVLPDQPPQAAAPLLEWMSAATIAERIGAGQRHHMAEIGGRPVGVVATRDDSHLNLLFVDVAFHGRGIARRLWEVALAACIESARPERITVNSSAFAVPAYRRLGFVELGPAALDRGVMVTPMEYRIRAAQSGARLAPAERG